MFYYHSDCYSTSSYDLVCIIQNSDSQILDMGSLDFEFNIILTDLTKSGVCMIENGKFTFYVKISQEVYFAYLIVKCGLWNICIIFS